MTGFQVPYNIPITVASYLSLMQVPMQVLNDPCGEPITISDPDNAIGRAQSTSENICAIQITMLSP
jgi:hypothetical protein